MVISKRYEKNNLGISKLTKNQFELKEEVEGKIENGQYVLEELKNCPLCDNKSFEILSEKDRYGFCLNTVICKKCGLVYTNPRFNQETYVKFYDSEYRGIYSDSLMPKKDFWVSQKKQGKKIFDYLQKIRRMDGLTTAEIGVGAGGILQYFKERGNRVVGVDFGEDYIKMGKSLGLDLIKGNIDELIKRKIKVDVLIYSHVFEHILDINKELDKIKRVLKEDGLLYLEVPGIRNLDKSCDMDFLKTLQNAHVYYFTLSTLTNFLSSNRFVLLKGDEHIRSVFRIGRSENKRESDYNSTISYLRKKETERVKFFPNIHIFLSRMKDDTCQILTALKLYKPVRYLYNRIKWK